MTDPKKEIHDVAFLSVVLKQAGYEKIKSK